jgi:hypothetical protein
LHRSWSAGNRPLALDHARHHSDTIIAGQDPEIGALRPVSVAEIQLKLVHIRYLFHFYRSVLRHAAGRMAPAERTYIAGSEFGKVFLRAHPPPDLPLAVIALAIDTRC